MHAYKIKFSGPPSDRHLALLAELWAQGLDTGGLGEDAGIEQTAEDAQEAQHGDAYLGLAEPKEP